MNDGFTILQEKYYEKTREVGELSGLIIKILQSNSVENIHQIIKDHFKNDKQFKEFNALEELKSCNDELKQFSGIIKSDIQKYRQKKASEMPMFEGTKKQLEDLI